MKPSSLAVLVLALVATSCGPAEDAQPPPKSVEKNPAPPPTGTGSAAKASEPPSAPAAARRPAPTRSIQRPDLRGGAALLEGDLFICADPTGVAATRLDTGAPAWMYSYLNPNGRTLLFRAGRRLIVLGSQDLALISIDDGKEVWRKGASGSITSLVVSGDVFVASGEGAAAYEISTLTRLWRRRWARGLDVASVLHGDAEGVLIQPEIGSGTYELEWIDARSGEVRWTRPGPHAHQVTRFGTSFLIARQDKTTVEVEVATGKTLYESPGRHLHLPSDKHRILIGGGGFEIQERAAGGTLWTKDGARPLLFEGDTLVYLQGGEVARADPATGKTLWVSRPGLGPKGTRLFGKTILVHDLSEAVALDRGSGAVLWRQGRAGLSARSFLANDTWLVLYKSPPVELLAFRMTEE